MRLLIKSLVLPPALNFLALLAALVVWRFYPRLAKTVMIGSMASLWVLSTPWVADALVEGLENDFAALNPPDLEFGDAAAIVILAGARRRDAPDFGGADTVAGSTLERLRYGAVLHRHSGLPVLTSGGSLHARPEPLAELMAQTLTEEFNIAVRWMESRSTNTWENAEYSRHLLAPAQIDSIVLVTHAWHMPRAVYAFEQVGFTVLPAPTDYRAEGGPRFHWRHWIPTTTALSMSRDACHEWLGRLYYRLAY